MRWNDIPDRSSHFKHCLHELYSVQLRNPQRCVAQRETSAGATLSCILTAAAAALSSSLEVSFINYMRRLHGPTLSGGQHTSTYEMPQMSRCEDAILGRILLLSRLHGRGVPPPLPPVGADASSVETGKNLTFRPNCNCTSTTVAMSTYCDRSTKTETGRAILWPTRLDRRTD